MEKLNQNQKGTIINVLSELSGVPVDIITEETTIKDGLGIDSLDLVEAVMRLENEFDITVPDEDYGISITLTVADFFKTISNHIN